MTTKNAAVVMIPCIEGCGLAIACRLPATDRSIEEVLGPKGWFLSVVSAPGDPITLAVLCDGCARRVYPRDVLDEMTRRREARTS